MSIIGKIQSIFLDREKTQPIFPITKTKAVSDENGRSLDVLLDDKASKDFVTAKIAEAQLSGGGGTGGAPGGGDSGQNPTVEPAEEDIPKVYFTGTLPTSKDEGDLKLKMRYISETADFAYPVTLKVQGGSSASYPKKNFTLKPYEDDTYESKVKLAFKNWGELDKFVLKAHWIDHSHVRNVGTAKIWGKIVKSRSDYDSLPEELRSSPNNGATDGFTCKVFCNGVYQGLYEWIVPKDKLFGQDSDIATHSILNSEKNNLATCAFATTSPTMSGSWSEELQDELSTDISTSFENLIKFVASSTDEDFVANAENYFDVQSVIDFDIFARVFCIVDNLCRNQIFFTYDCVKWYEGVWDVDAVLGAHPTGGSFFAYNTAFQTGYVAYKDFGITNLLYERVENLFMDRFKERYAELRADVLSIENIIEVYERLTDIITTYDGLLAEDFASTTGGGKFTGIPNVSTNNIQQLRNFVANRIPYMDSVVEALGKEDDGGSDDDTGGNTGGDETNILAMETVKMTYFEGSKRLDASTGAIIDSTAARSAMTKYVDVSDIGAVAVTMTSVASPCAVIIAEYDAEFNFISSAETIGNETSVDCRFVLSENAKYIRIGCAAKQDTTTIALSAIEAKTIATEDIIADKRYSTAGALITESDGSGWYTTGVFPLINATKIVAEVECGRVDLVTFDNAGTVVTGTKNLAPTDGVLEITVENTEKFAALSFNSVTGAEFAVYTE